MLHSARPYCAVPGRVAVLDPRTVHSDGKRQEIVGTGSVTAILGKQAFTFAMNDFRKQKKLNGFACQGRTLAPSTRAKQ